MINPHTDTELIEGTPESIKSFHTATPIDENSLKECVHQNLEILHSTTHSGLEVSGIQ